MKAKCPKCDKVFSKRTKKSAESALRLHIARKHNGMQAGGHQKLAANKSKRKYVRKPKTVPHTKLGFCPRCGLNVQVAETAINVALRHS